MEDQRTQEMATTPCPDCGQDRARGDESQIVYCGLCGREWHPGDEDYPTAFVPFRPAILFTQDARKLGRWAVDLDPDAEGNLEESVPSIGLYLDGRRIAHMTWTQADLLAAVLCNGFGDELSKAVEEVTGVARNG